jgi:chemotaxis protein MotB
MTTFSDLSTLLLTFFVLLLSMSSLDAKTLKSMFHNFSAGSGLFFFKEYGELYRPKAALIQGLQEILKDSLVVKKVDDDAALGEPSSMREDGASAETGSNVTLVNFKGGFKLVFGHKLLFPTGSAEVSEDMNPVLAKIGAFIRNSEYQVYVDGHTDNMPIRGGVYPSNEELSLARACSLMEYLVRKENVSPRSVAVAGYGDLHPVDFSQTQEGRGRNRRVEIIFKSQKYF